MRSRQRFSRSAIKYAWITPAVVALALVLIYFFGDRSADVADGGDSAAVPREVLHLGAAEATQHAVYSGPSPNLRRQVLQNLSVFRADYRVSAPKIRVLASAENGPGRQLAKGIGSLLAHHDLGRFDSDSIVAAEAADRGALVLRFPSTERSVARGLVNALAPLLRGAVLMQVDETLSPGRLLLVVPEEPSFTADGVAVFAP